MRLTRIAGWSVRIAPRLAWAFLAGAIVRGVRRLLRRPPRIWHGFTPMFFTRTHAESDERAGFPSRSVVRHSRLSTYALVRPEDFDVVYEETTRWDDAHWLCLIDLLRHGDIWFTHFESLFFRWDQRSMNELAFELIRAAGIRIIVGPHGGDIMHKHAFVSRYDWIGRAQLDYPQWDLVAQTEIARARIDVFCRHAALVLGADSSLARMLPRNDLYFPYIAMDTDALRPVPPSTSSRPRVIHAPNHRHTKGTEFLLRAIERLAKVGLECELVVIEGVPRHEALEIYASADIVADQFIIGGWGVFACEGMALGKPVMTYLDEDHLGNPVFAHPVINTTPETVDQVLAVLIAVPELRTRIGEIARRSMERYQSIDALAPVWKRIYEHVWRGSPLQLEETAMFSAERKARAVTEDPSRADFWPVPVDDLMPRIHAALRQLD